MWARHTGLPTSLGSHQVLPVHSAYVLTCLLTYHVPAHSAEAHLHPNVPPCGKGIASNGIAYTPLQGVQGRGGLQWGCRVGRRAQSKSTSDLGLSEASAGRSAAPSASCHAPTSRLVSKVVSVPPYWVGS